MNYKRSRILPPERRMLTQTQQRGLVGLCASLGIAIAAIVAWWLATP